LAQPSKEARQYVMDDGKVHAGIGMGFFYGQTEEPKARP
jgi:hypothetical protein